MEDNKWKFYCNFIWIHWFLNNYWSLFGERLYKYFIMTFEFNYICCVVHSACWGDIVNWGWVGTWRCCFYVFLFGFYFHIWCRLMSIDLMCTMIFIHMTMKLLHIHDKNLVHHFTISKITPGLPNELSRELKETY